MRTIRRKIVEQLCIPEMTLNGWRSKVMLSCGHTQEISTKRYELKQKTAECFRCTHIANGWAR